MNDLQAALAALGGLMLWALLLEVRLRGLWSRQVVQLDGRAVDAPGRA